MMELIKGYKQTSVGIIPEDWEVKEVGKAFKICNNLRFPISEDIRKTMQGEYPYYGPTKIQDWINEYRVEGKYALIGEDGDHFLKWRELPMTLLVEGKFNVNNHAHLIKGAKDYQTIWFFYYFNHKELSKYLTRQGAGRYKLTKDTLSKIPIPLPTDSELEKITNILSTWDKAIENCKKTIAHLKDRNKGLAQQLLSGKKRVKGFENTVWSSIKLKNCLKEINEFCEKDGSFEHLTLSKDGVFPKTERYNRDFLVTNEEKKYKITHKGYLCYNPANLKFGVICVNTYGTGIFSPIYVTYKILEKIDIQFAEYFFTQQNFINRVRKYEEGTVYERQAVKSSDFCKAYVTIPSIIEQKEIAKILYSASLELKTYELKLQTLQQQKKGLMQQLLTGKVRTIKN